MYDFFFRHHTYKKVDGQVELTEVGPRFEMKGKLHIVGLFFLVRLFEAVGKVR